tara:strand:+ start:80 stop:397 length:318 start_codon:yes stop_codon:yes gene_type:complete
VSIDCNGLVEAIQKDFDKWNEGCSYPTRKREIETKVGKKYIKIIDRTNNGQACWGFIVATDDDKLFSKGDILKSAGWSAPARNKPRGNVLEKDFSMVRWTGPDYL